MSELPDILSANANNMMLVPDPYLHTAMNVSGVIA